MENTVVDGNGKGDGNEVEMASAVGGVTTNIMLSLHSFSTDTPTETTE